ncbi:MAG TPA: hypothetical protein PLQ71_02850 [Nitrospira sp.]|nr:hypothetical protein [Nitrospira sp.]
MLRGQKRTPADFVRIVSELHPELDFSITEYKNARSLVSFICAKHGKQEIQANGLLRGRGCPKCGRSRSGLANAERIAEIGRTRLLALSHDEKVAQAARARAGRTKESNEKIAESQRQRWATDEAGKAAQSARAKKLAAEKWANTTPEQRKQQMAAVRAAKQRQ